MMHLSTTLKLANTVLDGKSEAFFGLIKFHRRGKVLMLDEADLNIAQTHVLRNFPEVNHFYDQFIPLIKSYEPNLKPRTD